MKARPAAVPTLYIHGLDGLETLINTILGTTLITHPHFRGLYIIILWIQDMDCPIIVDSQSYCCVQPGE